MTTAFALSGGGSLGAAQVGMLRALTACGIRADLVVGASVGALNAAYYAARPDEHGVEDLAELWRRVGEHDVYPLEMPEMLHGLLGRLAGRRTRRPAAALGVFNHVFPVNRSCGLSREVSPLSRTPRTVLGALVPGVLDPGAATRILSVVRSREAGSLCELASG
ncbi:patatin-like phospholipase family protein [Streptomyces bluensis]|uniref:Patatin-like phospholipase family protein n=1 Tax=Streptomyces bluensis TaxID=33897 RepID=A0ABW6U9U7_9ACTN